jgi:hypothetical protein
VGFELTTLVVIGTDCTGNYKTNYHTITTAPCEVRKIWHCITLFLFVCSITKDIFRGQQRPSKNEADRLERTDAGRQELSGYSENNDRFVAVNDDYKRFTTHYMTR